MKIFIDIGHPAHVHYFKNFIHSFKKKGHSFVITARDKEMAHYLLEKENIPYISRGEGGAGSFGKLLYLIKADWFLYKLARKEKPDLFLSFASPYCAHTAWLMGKPCITIDDTETAKFGQALYRPFSTKILTPQSFQKDFGEKQIRFHSFMELSYLHPDRFQPDPSIYDELGISQDEKYVIVRFVSMSANHDVGLKGISQKNKIKAVEAFSENCRVFITSESELPAELMKYKLNIKPHRIHHALAFASLLYGESGTMASEAAVLGTPAIFINKLANSLGTLKDQEKKYKLIHTFSDSAKDQKLSILKGDELLRTNKDEWLSKKNLLLEQNIDFTQYLISFIEEYEMDKISN